MGIEKLANLEKEDVMAAVRKLREPETKAYLYYIRDGRMIEQEGVVQNPFPGANRTWFKWYFKDGDIYRLKELQVTSEEGVAFRENVWYHEPNKKLAAVALAAFYMDRKNEHIRKMEELKKKIDICLEPKDK